MKRKILLLLFLSEKTNILRDQITTTSLFVVEGGGCKPKKKVFSPLALPFKY